MSVQKEWLYGKKELKAADVKKLPIGAKVTLHGSDTHGEHTMMTMEIVKKGNAKALYGHDGYGFPLVYQIRDYTGKAYTLEG